jgi:hypothetical protein
MTRQTPSSTAGDASYRSAMSASQDVRKIFETGFASLMAKDRIRFREFDGKGQAL